MINTLIHRGPDDEGMYQTDVHNQPGVFFGFRRLALIDLTQTGAQPMVSQCRRYVMVYNGEVYNDDDLRADLTKQGVCFRGHSDTEVILESIAAFGIEAAVKKLNGMFAIAIYDTAEKRLYLVRDRVGIKPLYWMPYKGGLAFASELKALMPLLSVRPSTCQKAVSAYLRYGYVPAPMTIYQSIFKLEPATILSFSTEQASPGKTSQSEISQSKYWSMHDVSHQTKFQGSFNDHRGDFHDLLRDSVRRCMHADVPVGSLLSGGIDSSLVTALMQSQSPQPISTFTIGFHERHFNEAEDAKRIAAHLGCDHHELYVTSKETQDVIPLLSRMYDEPFADSSAIPTFLVAKLARGQLKAVLSGDGGDEVFAGYKRYFLMQQFWSLKRKIPLHGAFGSLIEKLPADALDRMIKMVPPRFRVQNFGRRVNTLGGLLKSESMAECYGSFVGLWNNQSALRPGFADDPLDSFSAKDMSLDLMQQMQLIDTNTYLVDDILTKVDRASMAVSLEARVPLLDHRLIEMAWKMPTHWKVSNGQQGKLPLRSILEEYMPKELFDRPKMGFGVPLHDWLRGDLVAWVEDLLYDSSLAEVCDVNVARLAWTRHKSGAVNDQARIWALLMLQSWRLDGAP